MLEKKEDNFTTVFICFLKSGLYFTRDDTNAVGLAFMDELKKHNPEFKPLKVEQREFTKTFTVNAFPKAFEPLIMACIEERKKSHNLQPRPKKTFQGRPQNRGGQGYGQRRSGYDQNRRPGGSEGNRYPQGGRPYTADRRSDSGQRRDSPYPPREDNNRPKRKRIIRPNPDQQAPPKPDEPETSGD